MDTEIHSDTDDVDEDFDPYHDPTGVPILLHVRKPMDVCMEEGGSYPTALRQEIADGETEDGTHFAIHMGVANGRFEVSFDESDGPVVEFRPKLVVATAVRAARTRGYNIDTEPPVDDHRSLEVDERVGAIVADLATDGCIPESEHEAVVEKLPPTAADRFIDEIGE